MKKNILLTIISLGILGSLNAQVFYEFNNRHLSQSQLWNPGFMPQYKATLSVGQTYFDARMVGTTLNGLFGNSETPLQTVTRMVGEEDKQLGIDLNQQSDVFHFGFRSKKSYFSVNSSLISETSIRIPKDLLGLAFLGNSAYIDKDADLDFSGNQFRSYLKNTFSYGRFITDKLSVGVNASLINGIMDFSMDQARFQVGTDTGTSTIYSLQLSGEMHGRASVLGVDLDKAVNDSTYDANKTALDQLGQIQLGTNQGKAFGFGAVYRLNEKWRFSAAVQNLGSIVWDLGAQEIHMNKSQWEWNGLDTSEIKNLDADFATRLQDTVLDKFGITGTEITPYTTKLNPRYTLGAEFFITPRTQVQAFGGYGYGSKGDKSFVSTSVHQELGEWVDVRMGYSLYDFTDPNHRLSLGLSLNLGPLQIFGSVNDVLSIVNYGTTSVSSGMVGLNINIGRRKDKDYDEIPDSKDSCSASFGYFKNNGCPDAFVADAAKYKTPKKDDTLQKNSIETLPKVLETLDKEAVPALIDTEELNENEVTEETSTPEIEVAPQTPEIEVIENPVSESTEAIIID